MARAIQLANNGKGNVMPNPMVGCVIVYNNKIIGEGYHKKYGEAHAEVNAINSVTDKELLKNSTLYVNLEPCSHYGKTPPCADLIIKHSIPNVVIASKDPNPKVSGNGIKKLKGCGINVILGVLEQEAKDLNKRFFCFHEKHRPYIILKWAQTKDGFIDKIRTKTNAEPQWITNYYCKMLVHKWRSEEAAILVGANTIKLDNPNLNVREWIGNNPTRIIIANKTKLNDLYNVFDGKVRTILFTSNSNYIVPITAEKIVVSKENFIYNMLDFLYTQNVQSLFVEGGAETINSFICNNLFDEANVFIGNIDFHNGIKAPILLNYNHKQRQIINDIEVLTFKL